MYTTTGLSLRFTIVAPSGLFSRPTKAANIATYAMANTAPTAPRSRRAGPCVANSPA
jgi:hypothetical protein